MGRNFDVDKCDHKRKAITTHGRKSKGLHFCRKCYKFLSKRDFQQGFKPKERKERRKK